MERQLSHLVERLEKVYGDRLVSLILYGSAADGDYHNRYSDLNVFCVLSEITQKELAESDPIFRWWRELGHPSPLLMTEEEARTSADSFPIEFSEMQKHRKVLHGRDVIASLVIDRKHYRVQLEHDLRVKMLRLRQQATTALADRDALLKLCLDSVSTFCVLGRHALIISGHEAGANKRKVAEDLAGVLNVDMTPFLTLLNVRDSKTAPQEVDPVNLFGNYLSRIHDLIAFVDHLEE